MNLTLGFIANAGVVMAVALTIEMAFLGLTYASSIKAQPKIRRNVAVALNGCILILGCLVGATAAAAVAASPAMHTGLISFGVAALLYLVTEELLLEAHSEQEDHVWWIDLCFFLGFFLSFIMEKYSRS